MEERVSKGIEYGFLGMAVLSSFACLVRTDFNFAFALLCFYLWHSVAEKQDQRENIGKKLILLNLALLVLDLIWLITMGSVWGGQEELLENYSGVHNFAMFVSWVNWFLRLAILGGLGFIFKNLVMHPQSLISGEAYDMSSIQQPAPQT